MGKWLETSPLRHPGCRIGHRTTARVGSEVLHGTGDVAVIPQSIGSELSPSTKPRAESNFYSVKNGPKPPD